ncbi:unnamed protein product, partial [Amoebophrya sp. A25]
VHDKCSTVYDKMFDDLTLIKGSPIPAFVSHQEAAFAVSDDAVVACAGSNVLYTSAKTDLTHVVHASDSFRGSFGCIDILSAWIAVGESAPASRVPPDVPPAVQILKVFTENKNGEGRDVDHHNGEGNIDHHGEGNMENKNGEGRDVDHHNNCLPRCSLLHSLRHPGWRGISTVRFVHEGSQVLVVVLRLALARSLNVDSIIPY